MCFSYFAPQELSVKVSHISGVILLRKLTYRKVVSFNTSCLEAHAGFFRLLIKGIFGPYVTSVSKKLGQCTAVIHYCALSQFFETYFGHTKEEVH